MYLGIVICAHRRLVRPRAIPADQGAAGARKHGQGFPHHLGNLQNLPVHAGQIPGHPLGADRGLHGCLFRLPWNSRTQTRLSAHVLVILLASVLGILGSYGVAWFGIRINTVSNSRTAFSALKGNPFATLVHPAALRHERRPAARRGGIVLHDLHPDVPAARTGRPLLHRFRHRRIARRLACSASAAASSPRSPTSAPT